MSMSGIEVDDEVTTTFNDIKLKSTQKWATFKIEAKKRIVRDELGDPEKTESHEADKLRFLELSEHLKKEPRYVLYDFGFTNKEGRKINKLAFIFWCPEDSKIGDKMIYASSKDTVKKAFTGIANEFQVNDRGDLDYDSLSAEVEKKA